MNPCSYFHQSHRIQVRSKQGSQKKHLSVALFEKLRKLEAVVARQTKAAVACSGGVDSTLLLKIVHDTLGHENSIAVFAETPLLPAGEVKAARNVIQKVGSRLLTVGINPLVWPEFTANPQNRCYLCKKRIYTVFQNKLAELNFMELMDGTNFDDLNEFRPGLKALRELDVKTPLADVGMTKCEIRQLSKHFKLPTWNRPSSSCLATRIVSGQQIDAEKLSFIQKCEDLLKKNDFHGCRVRITADTALIELEEGNIKRFVNSGTKSALLKMLSNFNIKKVFLDLHGRKGIEI